MGFLPLPRWRGNFEFVFSNWRRERDAWPAVESRDGSKASRLRPSFIPRATSRIGIAHPRWAAAAVGRSRRARS